MKNFPIPVEKILPAAIILSTASAEASTTRNPVVAPAGTVLRVRLDQALDTRRSRPGDRVSGILDSQDCMQIVSKGTIVGKRVDPSNGLHLRWVGRIDERGTRK